MLLGKQECEKSVQTKRDVWQVKKSEQNNTLTN